ncbi:MAG: PAS domain S-box protein [Deltaproteobacteria bacterium]|nr:PAS domain S-box protein [Deltaproteobacteria bacterium]
MSDQAPTYEQLLKDNDSLRRSLANVKAELEQVRNTLGKAESRYRTLFESSPDLIYYMDHEGKIVSMNKTGVYLIDCESADTIVGQTFNCYIHPEDQEKVMASFLEAVAAQQEITKGLTFRLLKQSGRVVWVELHSRMSFDEQGNFLEEVGVLRDVTERKEMEERLFRLNRDLAETNRKLQEAYAQMRDRRDVLRQSRYEEDIGFLVDRDGRIEWVSETALSFSGKPRSTVIGALLPELLPEESREGLRKAIREAWMGVTFPCTIRFASMEGDMADMQVKMTRLTSPDTRRLWAAFQRSDEKPAGPVV